MPLSQHFPYSITIYQILLTESSALKELKLPVFAMPCNSGRSLLAGPACLPRSSVAVALVSKMIEQFPSGVIRRNDELDWWAGGQAGWSWPACWPLDGRLAALISFALKQFRLARKITQESVTDGRGRREMRVRRLPPWAAPVDDPNDAIRSLLRIANRSRLLTQPRPHSTDRFVSFRKFVIQ